jgi:hypothetical protein
MYRILIGFNGIGIGIIIALVVDNLNIVLIEGYDFLNIIISYFILFFIAMPLSLIVYTPIFNKIYDGKLYKFLLNWQYFVCTLYIITTIVLYDILAVSFFENEILNKITLINSYCILGMLIYLIFQTLEKNIDQYSDLRSFTSRIESYSGDKKKDNYHGKGVLMFQDDEKYEGNFLNGRFHGFGTYTYGPKSIDAGDKYEGYYKKGKKSGKGILKIGDWVYEGQFIDDLANGFGQMKFGNGDTYKGEFKDGKKHGYGTYKFATGEIDKGFYKNDIFVERDDD